MKDRDILSVRKSEVNCISCTPNPCLNQAKCIEFNATSLYCSCSWDFYGERCETDAKQVICDTSGGFTVKFDKRYVNKSIYSRISLRDRNCKATSDDHFVVIFTTLHSCGTGFTKTNDAVIIENDVTIAARQAGSIQVKAGKNVKATCKYPKNHTFQPRTVINSTEVGIGSFSLSFTLLKDGRPAQFPVHVALKDTLSFEIKAFSKEVIVGLIIESCWVRPTLNPLDLYKYIFISNCCPTGETVKLEANTEAHLKFQIEAFRIFHPAQLTAFVHCKVFYSMNSTDEGYHCGCQGDSLPIKHGNQQKTKGETISSFTSSQTYDLQNGPFVNRAEITNLKDKGSSKNEIIVYILSSTLGIMITCFVGWKIFRKVALQAVQQYIDGQGDGEFDHIDAAELQPREALVEERGNAGFEHEEPNFQYSDYGTIKCPEGE